LPDTISIGSFVLGGGAGVPAELVDQARTDARAVGYAQGWTQGQREAAEVHASVIAAARADQARFEQVRAERLELAVQSVHAAAEKLDHAVVQLTDEISDRILAAAVELAAALLGQELRDRQTSAAAALARVMRLAPDNEPVTIWLSPQDYETVTDNVESGLAGIIGPVAAGRITLECDPALTVGDALARSAATSIEAKLTEALARLRDYAAGEQAAS
jgi:flagellar assembly protein FliH